MLYAEHAPCAALRPFVECFWTLSAPACAPAHRVLPDGCVDLLFDLAAGARVVGAMTRALISPSSPRPVALFGVRFHPGEAAPLLRVAARELRDDAVALGDVWGPLGRALEEAVLAAPSTLARVRAVERVLLARLGATDAGAGDVAGVRVRGAVALLRAADGARGIDGVARDVGVSSRGLERAFDERVGVGPKLFQRVVRVQRLVATIDRGAAVSWSALAAELGYADQAHLVREVGELAGATPSALLRERRAVSEMFNPSSARGATVPPSPL